MSANAPVSVRQVSEPLAMISRQPIVLEAPAPVSLGGVRQIHTPFRSQPEQSLQGHYRCVSHRRRPRANEVPLDLFVARTQVFQAKVALVFGGFGITRRAFGRDAVE